jgi:pyruvate kinase
MKRNRKAKILATLGPASNSSDTIEKIFSAGTDVFRLNFSHSTIEEHRKNVDIIRSLEKKYNHPTCILADLQGPKLRIGNFTNKKENLKRGESFTFDLDNNPGNKSRVNFPHPEIYEMLTPNTFILINDGKLKMQIIEQKKDSLIVEVLNDGEISDNKGVNIPDAILPISSLTSKDKSDLNKALEMGADWIALSFIQTVDNVRELKKLVGSKASVMAKIEKPSALKNINEIIAEADGIMIARGDLGVELPLEKVPSVQKTIINECRKAGKPVVVATQMLESMINNPTPSRAEASDVANAIYDGSDAVMLSGESAIGKYPVETVTIMNKIIENVERDTENYNITFHHEIDPSKIINTSEAITSAAYTISRNADAKTIITFSVSGNTTSRMSKERAPVQIIGISPNIMTARKLQIMWGVHSCHHEDAHNVQEMVSIACSVAKDKKIAIPGDSVVITAGVPFGNAGATNLLRIAKIIVDKDLT